MVKLSVRYLFFGVLALMHSHPVYSDEPEFIKITGNTQGTTYHITYQNVVRKNLQLEVEERLNLIDQLFSTYNPHSLVSQVNEADRSIKVTPIFQQLLQKSFLVYEETQGAFDITVGPLVEAWGFGPVQHKMPTAKQVDSLMKIVGLKKIHLKKNVLIKSDKRIRLDFNAIAQGFTVDFLAQYFDSLGISNYLIEVGGELFARGTNASGLPWRIGIETPSEGNQLQGEQIQKIIGVSNLAVSTSGNYRRFYVSNGIKYAHTIDPHTGYPAKNTLLSVTIVAPNCTDADAYATACMVMGLDKAIQFIKNKPFLNAYFIYSGEHGEYREYITDNLKKLIVE